MDDLEQGAGMKLQKLSSSNSSISSAADSCDELEQCPSTELAGGLRKYDSFTEIISRHASYDNLKVVELRTILKLAVQSIGVVYGDLGTSPLYVLPSVFPNGIRHNDDILGALSLIFYSILIIFAIKYVFIVLPANDNGDGGTFALYSLICRYAKVGLIPSQQAEDGEISSYKLDVPTRRFNRATMIKAVIENSKIAKYLLLCLTMLGTSMVIGDGILTPVISVLSAVGGIKAAATSLTNTSVMWISVVILVLLFQVQRFGTHKVGYSFAPILTIWFIFIGVIGIYNFVKHDPTVIKAVNPAHIVTYFKRNKKDAWLSLGGIILCLTGSEALFADLGHFHIRSIQLSSCSLVLPSILMAYFGQASYLRKHEENVSTVFYSSTPKAVYWPMFVIAVMAAIIASQSLISAAFSIVKQSVALGCFPRVKIVHTSDVEGQIYIPEVNFLLMLACIGVTLGFKDTIQIGNAYGIAVAMVFVITSMFLIIVMLIIWKTNMVLILTYILTIGVIELSFLSAVLFKFADGGYLPLIFSFIMVVIMLVWNYGYRTKYLYEFQHKVSSAELIEIASNPKLHRIPGLALFYSELVQGITPIFAHYVSNLPALHSILVFVSIKSVPISHVPVGERFLFKRLDPHELSIFRCVVRYGYMDGRMGQEGFEGTLIEELKEFIVAGGGGDGNDVAELEQVRDGGVTYLLGESEMVVQKLAGTSACSFAKMVVINYLFSWLKRAVRQQDEVLMIPRKRLIKVGITYEVS